jgi:hypothetical protein
MHPEALLDYVRDMLPNVAAMKKPLDSHPAGTEFTGRSDKIYEVETDQFIRDKQTNSLIPH